MLIELFACLLVSDKVTENGIYLAQILVAQELLCLSKVVVGFDQICAAENLGMPTIVAYTCTKFLDNSSFESKRYP